MKQNDAKRLFKAARDAGFDAAKIVIHPDGRIEAVASFSDQVNPKNENSWDDVLR